MKRFLLTGLAVIGLAAALPATASAETTTTTPTVPTDCLVQLSKGPSRVVHGNPATVATYSGPDCSDVAGLCIDLHFVGDAGPSRAVHGRPDKTAGAPCVPLGPACDLDVNYGNDDFNVIVPIPDACQELMVLALTPTGSDTAPTIWIATAFLGAGAVLIVAPRRLARR